MGVKKLWSVVEPTGHPVQIRDLRGQRVAVDLCGWLVECSLITSPDGHRMPGLKPHLRYIKYDHKLWKFEVYKFSATPKSSS